jgi:AcrR family transcriptional regulator
VTAPARGRRGQGEHTREEILAAAEALLVAGASEEEVSVRAVADAVGVTPPAIYRHFPDKDHLLFEVCARQFGRLGEAFEAVTRSVADPIDALSAVARAYARFALENPEHYRIMFMGHADHTPDAYADLGVLDTGSFGLVVHLVQAAIDAGRVRDGLTAERVAFVLWGAVHGVVSIAVAKPRFPGPPIEDRVEAMIDVLLRGIEREGGR